MKVKGRVGTEDLQTVREMMQQDAVRIHSRQKGVSEAGQTESSSSTQSVDTQSEGQDRVTLGNLSRLLSSELDPTAMATERRQRIEELKKLVASGKYNPPVQEVAKAVTQEIAAEIFTSQVQFGDDEE